MLLFTILFLASLVFSFVDARLDSLYSSSVTYCSPPESLLIQEFKVQYFRHNSSVVFDITASSLSPNLNVTATIGLNAYGLEPIDLTFNLCEISKALCPLPQYNFSGFGTVPIPAVQGHIPGIAYLIPDLEAAARLTLTRIEDKQVVGCVETTLSNGLSLRQAGVSWGVGSLAIVAFLLSVGSTASQVLSESSTPHSALAYRFISLMQLCQHIASSAFLYLNYPVAFRSFAVNFAWAFGLFAASEKSPLQRSINRLRSKTGSKDANDGALQVVDFVNRKLSPYNDESGGKTGSLSAIARRRFDFTPASSSTSFAKRQFITPATVMSSQPDRLPAGIPLYVNSMGIPTGNTFMSMFYTALILAASLIVASLVAYAVISCIDRVRKERAGILWRIKQDFWTIFRKCAIRVLVVCLIPISTLGFYQWTIVDSWLAVLLSVILICFIWSVLGFTTFQLFRTTQRNDTSYFAPAHRLHYLTAFTEQYTRPRWFFTVFVILPFAVLKAAFTSFPKFTALAQVSGFIVVEFFQLALLLVLRPYTTKSGQALEIFLSLVRLITSGMLIAFVESVGVKPIPRAAVGFITCVIYSIAILVLFFNLFYNLWPRSWCCGRLRKEKDEKSTEDTRPTSSQPSTIRLEEGGTMEKSSRSLSHSPSPIRVSKISGSTLVQPTSPTFSVRMQHVPIKPPNTSGLPDSTTRQSYQPPLSPSSEYSESIYSSEHGPNTLSGPYPFPSLMPPHSSRVSASGISDRPSINSST